MEYTLVVDQLALRRWHGKIDAEDALLVAFISKLNSHNPEVARHMEGDFFRLNRSWILTELPLLDITEYTLSRRLHQLQKLGVLDLKNPHGLGGHMLLYGRMSKLWYQEVEKAKKEIERHSPPTCRESHMAEKPHGENDRCRLAQTTTAETTHDHIKNDHEEADAPPLSAAGDAPPLQEKESAPSPFPEDPTAIVPSKEILAAQIDNPFAVDRLRRQQAAEPAFPDEPAFPEPDHEGALVLEHAGAVLEELDKELAGSGGTA